MTKRQVLTGLVFVIMLTGIAMSSIPFVRSMGPPQYKVDIEYKRYNTPLIVDVSGLEEGKLRTVVWQGVPIGIYRRTKTDIELLQLANPFIYDPLSQRQSLPEWWKKMSVDLSSPWIKTFSRSIKEEYLVFNQVSPVFGCAVLLKPPEDLETYGFLTGFSGGFYDPCHDVKFDLSGRVYVGRSTGRHLFIPPHRYLDEQTIELYPNG